MSRRSAGRVFETPVLYLLATKSVSVFFFTFLYFRLTGACVHFRESSYALYFQPLLNYITFSSKFLGFRMGVVEVSVLLGWRAMPLGEWCPKF